MQKIKSRSALVDGVIDLSTYEGYRNTRAIKSTVINGLLKNLNLTLNDFYYFLAKKNNSTVLILDDYHHAIMNTNYSAAKNYKSKISKMSLLSKDEKKYFDYLVISNEYFIGNINTINYEVSLKELVKYSDIYSQGMVSFLDLLILKEIAYCVNGEEKLRITDFLIEQFNYRQTWQHTETSGHILLLLQQIANLLGCLEHYEKSAVFATTAITMCLKYEEAYLLEYFYCQLAFCKHFMNDYEGRDHYVLECYLVLMVKKNEDATKKFLDIFNQTFKITNIEINPKIVDERCFSKQL